MRAVANILKGKKVYPKTRLYLQPASWNVYRECMAEGLFDTILDAGANCYLLVAISALACRDGWAKMRHALPAPHATTKEGLAVSIAMSILPAPKWLLLLPSQEKLLM